MFYNVLKAKDIVDIQDGMFNRKVLMEKITVVYP